MDFWVNFCAEELPSLGGLISSQQRTHARLSRLFVLLVPFSRGSGSQFYPLGRHKGSSSPSEEFQWAREGRTPGEEILQELLSVGPGLLRPLALVSWKMSWTCPARSGYRERTGTVASMKCPGPLVLPPSSLRPLILKTPDRTFSVVLPVPWNMRPWRFKGPALL